MKAVANVFAALALVALGYWGVYSVTPRVYQAYETRRFARELRNDRRPRDKPSPFKSAEAVEAPERPSPSKGSALAILAIPRLGLSTIVVEGTEERELKLGPGHIPGTPLPGGGGNVGVAGHRDTFFRPLRRIRKDDTIQVITHEQEYRYKVVSTEIVGPDDIQVLYPIQQEMLTLVTCYPFEFVGPAPKRFIVRADCVNCPPPNLAGRILHRVP